MRVRAELRCYHCGHTAARVERESGHPLSEAEVIWQRPESRAALPAAERLRCQRCHGPLFMDEEEVIRYDFPPVSFDRRPRRGPRRGGSVREAGTIARSRRPNGD
jgi:hypothetical protein